MPSEDLPPPRPSFFTGDRGSFSSVESGSSDSDSPVVSPHRRNPRGSGRGGSADWNNSIYSEVPPTPNSATPFTTGSVSSRAPPSAYVFPFQAHPGNPDPGTSVPGHSRRNSVESLPPTSPYQTFSQSSHVPYTETLSQPSSVDAHSPPFRGSLPRVASTSTFRAPFLSPASRPTSSLWSPPSYPFLAGTNGTESPAGSSAALAAGLAKGRPPTASTKLPAKLTKEDKPWTTQKSGRERMSWWVTVICLFLGLGGAAVLVWQGIESVELLKDSDLCPVFEENWSNGISDDDWVRDVELGGFGNGEFQVCTAESKNSYIQNNELYIMPTLMSDDIGKDSVLDGYTFKVDSCSTDNTTACQVTSKKGSSVINPVKSARLTTKGKHTIKFGKVEVKAKLPRGDWLWPAIWMLPQDDSVYGKWPMGGEIDIMEARGNAPEYPAQGYNFVRSSLNYGPLAGLITKTYGWWQVKQGGYNKDFHTYSFEWDDQWMRMYVDSRLHAMLKMDVKKESQSMFERGNYPATAMNDSTEVVVTNPWADKGTWMAPYDQDFYLIINLAVGGTSGWFPDDQGSKPWHDASAKAMVDFANDQDTWSATWPSSADDRAFRISSVKMWKLKDGSC